MKFKVSRTRGFGIIESLLVLTLFAIMMVVIGDLVTSYRAVMRQSQGRSRTLKSAQVALGQLRSDICAATEIVTPATGSSQVLELQRLVSALSPRLPSVVATKPPKSWDILSPADQYRINYRLDSERLMRILDGEALVLASGLNDFNVSVNGQQYEISLVIKERARDFNLVSRVSRL